MVRANTSSQTPQTSRYVRYEPFRCDYPLILLHFDFSSK
jgi:hypothetical protein